MYHETLQDLNKTIGLHKLSPLTNGYKCLCSLYLPRVCVSLESSTIYNIYAICVLSQCTSAFHTMWFLNVTSLSFGRVQDLLSPEDLLFSLIRLGHSSPQKPLFCQLCFPSPDLFFRIFLASLFFSTAS